MSREQEASKHYETLFIEFSTKVETLIKRGLIGLVLLLLIIQILLHIPGVASLLSPVFSMEGKPINPALSTWVTGNED
ncbi:hypothetical protein M3231_13720 [Neobacillus mesonae]|nr:hypothetical protein [Neobacillus mesonae]